MTEYTIEDIQKYVDDNRADLTKRFMECEEVPEHFKIPDSNFSNIWDAGCWMGKVLKENGASDEEDERICFAHGQTCFSRDPFESAVSMVNEFLETGTTKDQPGPELAEQIIRESGILDDRTEQNRKGHNEKRNNRPADNG